MHVTGLVWLAARTKNGLGPSCVSMVDLQLRQEKKVGPQWMVPQLHVEGGLAGGIKIGWGPQLRIEARVATRKFFGRLIHPQRIYNLWSIHVVILSFLDVLQSFYSNFISFFGTNLLTQCTVPVDVFAFFLHHRKSISNGVQTLQNFLWIFMDQKTSNGPEQDLGGAPRGSQPTKVRLVWLYTPRWPPVPPVRPIKRQIFQKPSGLP